MPFFVIHEANQPDRLAEVHTSHIIIGRGTHADLVLANVSVSREHARLDVQPDGQAILTALADDNPLFVGDQEVFATTVLATGSRARIGKYGLTYLHEDALDLFQVQQLSEMPRFSRRGANDAETHIISAALQQRLLQIEMRREFGALVDSGGHSHHLGAESIEVGPSAAIPCPGRWGSGAAATATWVGAQHQLSKASMFAKLSVNGESHKQRMLEPGDVVEINGAQFVYQAERQRRRRR